MDHGDLLRDCRHMLLAMSSQISLLLAGLQRLEGQQRHPQPPPPPPIPEVHPPPLPPPSTPPPHLPATTVRPDHLAAPVTLVATTDSRAEHPALTRTVSVSTSWEHRRRRRSRHREPHRRPIPQPSSTVPRTSLSMQCQWVAVMLILLSIHRQLKPCQLADRLVCPMNDDGATATKVRQSLLHSCLHVTYLCLAAALSLCSFA